jgi:hypothetical protein
MRRRIGLAALVFATIFAISGPANAVIRGAPDGNRHPYVGLVFDFIFACSGFAVSPTVFVTAAHCFDQPGDVQPPGATVYATFEPDPLSDPNFTPLTGR